MESLALACAIVGLSLNVVGTGLAGRAIVQDFHKYSEGQPLVPFVSRVRTWLAQLWRSSADATVHSVSASGSVKATGEVHLTVIPAPDAPVSEQIRFLRDELDRVKATIAEQRGYFVKQIEQVGVSVERSRAETQDLATELRSKVRDVVSGTARVQLLGLTLVGVGSIVAAVPTIFGWT